jgi:succinate dehydrogenase flavin-adding protein (antitoxin of CptAB toxin-antitoxin module)
LTRLSLEAESARQAARPHPLALPRGLLELDLVLERFLERHLESTDAGAANVQGLLELPDNDCGTGHGAQPSRRPAKRRSWTRSVDALEGRAA